MDRIYTHPGSVHSDELIAIAIVLHVFYKNLDSVEIRREEPPKDIAPSDWVLDQGKELNALMRRIDHHQLTASDPTSCTFSLLLENLGYGESAKQFLDWYTNFTILDAKGPDELAKHLKTDVNVIYSLQSPVDMALKEEFKKAPDHVMVKYQLQTVGKHIITSLQLFQDRVKLLDVKADIIDIGKHGIQAVLFKEAIDEPAFGMRKWLELNEHTDVAISVTVDERGGGWSLYRFGDHPKIDFTKIKGEKDVVYVPNTGFVAKVKQGATRARLLELINKSIKR